MFDRHHPEKKLETAPSGVVMETMRFLECRRSNIRDEEREVCTRLTSDKPVYVTHGATAACGS
jgi:hypothetical protein